MSTHWKKYQEETATFFRDIGMDAKTDIKVKGSRCSHDVDVLVRSHQAGFDILWVVECKCWRTRISKLHVLALRQNVTDVGADRGLLLSESGFQSGAIEAANLTNVRVASLEEVRKKTRGEFAALHLRELFDRFAAVSEEYVDIPKEVRIEMGLRRSGQSFGRPGFSGLLMVRAVDDLLKKTFRGKFPIPVEADHHSAIPQLPGELGSPESSLHVLEPIVRELEKRVRRWKAKVARKR